MRSRKIALAVGVCRVIRPRWRAEPRPALRSRHSQHPWPLEPLEVRRWHAGHLCRRGGRAGFRAQERCSGARGLIGIHPLPCFCLDSESVVIAYDNCRTLPSWQLVG